MIFDAWDNYSKDVNNLILNIQQKILGSIQQKQDKIDDIVYSSLSTGAIKYKNGYFTGSFTKKLLNYLIELGGVKTTRGLKFDVDKLPRQLKRSIELFDNNRQNQIKNVLYQLNKIDIGTIIDVGLVSVLTSNIFKRLSRNFYKEKLSLKNNFNSSLLYSIFYQNLLNGLENSIKYIKDNLITKQELSITDIENRLKNLINGGTKNVLLNTINQTLFEMQQEQAKENDIDGFYWWHRPKKRPSDRLYHRKHYEDSLKGKKFYWDNLPIFQGERDFPGKLWHCHCRAFIRKKEFLDAKE